MENIKAIDKSTVHRICSGQVVLNLAIAVKELVENSIDAGATVVDVRFKEYGSELVEVSDNGSGVHPSNFEGLTLKHHTSKLKDFSDLISVETFGFRGEALSSLCALSELSVLTRHESEPCGTSLVFDRNGHIIERNHQSRQVGTTVSLTNLFSTLPVRQKEFHKNLKREFNKMTQLLYAYCLVSTGVKINCVNQTKKGSRTTFMATQGCKTVKENISCIFGAKQLNNLLEINQKNPSQEVLEDLKLTADNCSIFKLEGYISSCAHGAGRGTNDRQFYFINSRPCEPSKIMKQVNEVYHQFNGNQYPFVYLNINVMKGAVDVNVTPDKRQIFLTQEKLILAIIKASLLDLYEKIPSTYSTNELSSKSISNCKVADKFAKNGTGRFDSWRHKNDKIDNKRRFEALNSNDVNPKKQLKIESAQAQKTLEAFNVQINSVKTLYSEKIESNVKCNDSRPITHDNENSGGDLSENPDKHESRSRNTLEPQVSEKIVTQPNKPKIEFNVTKLCDKEGNYLKINNMDSISQTSAVMSEEITPPTTEGSLCGGIKLAGSFESECNEIPENTVARTVEVDNVIDQNNVCPVCYVLKCTEDHLTDDNTDSKPVVCDEFEERGVKSVTFPMSLQEIKDAFMNRTAINDEKEKQTSVRFKATIEPSKNDQAEKELNKEISKDKFEKMEIIGQFNLGFIITKLGSDLFIIDQHATDEKYNFETLQKTTVISNQKLVNPQNLELTAANECVLMDNIDVFRKNGFEFDIDEEAPPTKRIKLTAIPMSKNWVFGKDDIDELIFMLEDSPGTDCRPSRVRAMFASRACRKSVMIGTALNHKDMRKLVDNMGTIEQPWNCPHGRPTMRHLVNLDLINIKT